MQLLGQPRLLVWRLFSSRAVVGLASGSFSCGCASGEAAISGSLRRTMASSLGGYLSYRRKYSCLVFWVCSCSVSLSGFGLGIEVGSCRNRCFNV
ncbi:hypothetical protein F2Q69_00056934 [Brassica cretica]|uniref:Secreted protein n=1 Tax=Brassica cretica TaxID=69181 RepID=A0A8S9N0F0_BRACR|nr:hypothetical protein F2Q69_00056934 [Brassica cretica]